MNLASRNCTRSDPYRIENRRQKYEQSSSLLHNLFQHSRTDFSADGELSGTCSPSRRCSRQGCSQKRPRGMARRGRQRSSLNGRGRGRPAPSCVGCVGRESSVGAVAATSAAQCSSFCRRRRRRRVRRQPLFGCWRGGRSLRSPEAAAAGRRPSTSRSSAQAPSQAGRTGPGGRLPYKPTPSARGLDRGRAAVPVTVTEFDSDSAADSGRSRPGPPRLAPP